MKFLKSTLIIISIITMCGCLNLQNTNALQNKFDIKSVEFDENTYDCVILGGGIGGLTSSVYVSMAGFESLVIQGNIPGGLITQSNMVENWPGEIKISGQNLAKKIREQALSHTVKIIKSKVSDVNFNKWPYLIRIKSFDSDNITELKALLCIISMGTTPNFLNIPNEKEYNIFIKNSK